MNNTNNRDEQAYLDLLYNIYLFGDRKEDRTGIGTRSRFGTRLSFSLENQVVPVLTTKKVFIRGVIEELLFFIRGQTDSKLLEAKGVNIWKGNTSRDFLDKRGLQEYAEGEMGPMYGAQWRNFQGVDQLSNALELLKKDPNSRRIMVSAYDPSVSKQCVLEPCHTFFQFNVSNNKLDCQWYQRSVDAFLGFGFNVLSYGILTHLMAKAAKLETGNLIFCGGDTHIYNNHREAVEEQVRRDPYSFPTMTIKKEINSIEDMENLEFEDFEFHNYQSHAAIKAPMAI